jgi:hypothetical protein
MRLTTVLPRDSQEVHLEAGDGPRDSDDEWFPWKGVCSHPRELLLDGCDRDVKNVLDTHAARCEQRLQFWIITNNQVKEKWKNGRSGLLRWVSMCHVLWSVSTCECIHLPRVWRRCTKLRRFRLPYHTNPE